MTSPRCWQCPNYHPREWSGGHENENRKRPFYFPHEPGSYQSTPASSSTWLGPHTALRPLLLREGGAGERTLLETRHMTMHHSASAGIFEAWWFLPFFFFFFFWLCHLGTLFPNQGSNPCPLHWKHGVLTTGLPGKSLNHATFLFWDSH